MGSTVPLEFQDIIEVLQSIRGRIATVTTIAQRLQRGVSLVQRACDRMRLEGLLQLVPTFQADQYRLIDGAASTSTIRPYDLDESADPPAGDDGEDDGAPAGSTLEQLQAAALWRTRLGDQRWHDDPRALRERVQNVSHLPPFYNGVAREI